jgi:tetratricopeptide (TPR) repeat protein
MMKEEVNKMRRWLLGLMVCQLIAAPCAQAVSPQSDADSVRHYRNQAVDNFLRGRVDEALESYAAAAKLAEKAYGANSTLLSDIYYDAGMVALHNDRFQKAEECLKKACEVNPNSIEAHLKYAEYLKLRGKSKESRQEIDKVLHKHNDSIEARQLLAFSYQDEGNVAKATRECYLIDQLSHGRASVDDATPASPMAVMPAAKLPRWNSKTEPPKKAEPEVAQPAKPDKKAKVETKPKPEAKPKPEVKAADTTKRSKKKKPEVAQPQVARAESLDVARLKSKAVLLTKVKNLKKASETSAQTSETSKPEGASEPTAEMSKLRNQPSAVGGEPMPETAPADEGATEKPAKPVKAAKKAPAPVVQKPKKMPRGGLVPPPPPVVPVFAPMMPPPPPAAAPKPKPKPVEKPEKKPEPTAKPDEGDNPDFLLDWAGKKKK